MSRVSPQLWHVGTRRSGGGRRTGLGRCWMLVVASEIFGVPGVGREILRASNNLLVDTVIAYILVLSLMYLLVDVAFRAVQRRVLVWRA